MQQLQPTTQKGFTLKPGETRFGPGGQQVASVPAAPQTPKAPQTREIKIGDEVVTQQFDPATNTWIEIARAPAQQPKQPTPALSPERFEQEKDIQATKAKADVDKAIEVNKAVTQFNQNTPAGKLKQKVLEGKVAQQEINKNKQKMRQEGKAAKANLVEGKVDEAIALVNQWFTTGFLGQMLSGNWWNGCQEPAISN